MHCNLHKDFTNFNIKNYCYIYYIEHLKIPVNITSLKNVTKIIDIVFYL